jgi:malate dehydrogenase (oxaloacetate-decarboxylating)(NADP+)
MSDSLKKAALDYHAFPKPGKLSVELTTPAESQEDLSLAYSPGVAELAELILKILKLLSVSKLKRR